MNGTYEGYKCRIESCARNAQQHIEMGRYHLAQKRVEEARLWLSEIEKEFGQSQTKKMRDEIKSIKTKLKGLDYQIGPNNNLK